MTSPPVGGGVGQVLTKNSAADQDWSWQGTVNDPFVNTYWPGYWYTSAMLFYSSNTNSVNPSTSSNVVFYPLFLPYSIKISALAYESYSGGAGQTSVGVYSTVNSMPASLICSAPGLPQTQGVRVGTLTPSSYDLPAGWVYLAIASTAGLAMQGLTYQVVPPLPGGFSETPTTSSGTYGVALFTTTTGGVLPVSPTTFTMGSPGSIAAIWFRVA